MIIQILKAIHIESMDPNGEVFVDRTASFENGSKIAAKWWRIAAKKWRIYLLDI